MNAARRAARAGRNLLLAVIVGGLIIVAIAVAYVAGGNASRPSAQPQVPSRDPSTSAAAENPVAGAAPTGCLGGASRSNAMLLEAQRLAPRSAYGAVEVATAFFRWSYRYPSPASTDVRGVSKVFVPDESQAAQSSLIADYKRNKNASAGAVPDGVPFSLSTVGGKWLVDEGSAESDRRVSVLVPLVVDGELSATKTTSEAFDMRWVDDAWRVAAVARAMPERIAAGGTAFTAGC